MIDMGLSQDQKNAISSVMGMPQGREFVMWSLEFLCHWNEPAFSSDHGTISYNVGQQAVGNALFKFVESVQPELARKMLAEWRDRREIEEKKQGDGS